MEDIKIAVLGGGTGMSVLLRGLKKLPFDISAVVSVCDDGKSTGRLREEFNMPAMGDIRKVLISLSENAVEVGKLLDYRFDTYSDLDGHALGNLLLAGANDITGNMSDGIELLNTLLKLKGKVIPLTEDNVTLVGVMEDASIVEGEHNITEDKRFVREVMYKEKPQVNPDAIKAIRKADAIILSMGSLFTSIMPNLICEEVQQEIENSDAKIIYVCNVMTQPGETDDFSVSHHVRLLNKYLGKRQVDAVVVNTGDISQEIIDKYSTTEQKDIVEVDYKQLEELNVDLIKDNYVIIENNLIRHNALKVATDIFSYLMD
ncbi:MAG: gluconeogenesis factor YvcK family protein [Bacilli bacterium]